MDFPHVPKFSSFDEWIAYMADLRAERDVRSWILGQGADEKCSVRPNGGKPGPEEFTIARFAHALNEEPSVVGEWRNNYHFWAENFESIPENASWRQCADARRRSGWRPGGKITHTHIIHALKFLMKAVDEGAPHIPDLRPSWRRRLARACDLLSAIAADPELPPLIGLAIRTLLSQVAPNVAEVARMRANGSVNE